MFWVSLSVLVLCVVGVILIRRPATPQVLYRDMKNGSLLAVEKAQVASVQMTPRNGETWTLIQEKADGGLSLEGEAVDRSLGNMILEAASNITYEEILTEDPAVYEQDPEEFGFQDPLAKVTIRYTDGKEMTLILGNSGVLEESFYYMLVEGDPRLFAVDKGTVQILTTERALLHPVQQPAIVAYAIDSIKVKEKDGTVRIGWECKGSITDTDAGENWFLTDPYVYPADEDTVQGLRENAGKLLLGAYVGEGNEKNLKRFGLKDPDCVLELHTAAVTVAAINEEGQAEPEEKPEETFIFTIGDNKNEMVSYVLYEDAIYTMNRFQLAIYTDADPKESASRYVATVSWENLQGITVEDEQGTVTYTVNKRASLDENGTEMRDTEGRNLYEGTVLKNGEEIPLEAFRAAYERMMVVTVSGRLPSGYRASGNTTKKYTFHTNNGGTHILELSDFDDLHDAVAVDGCSLFYLLKNSLPALP